MAEVLYPFEVQNSNDTIICSPGYSDRIICGIPKSPQANARIVLQCRQLLPFTACLIRYLAFFPVIQSQINNLEVKLSAV